MLLQQPEYVSFRLTPLLRKCFNLTSVEEGLLLFKQQTQVAHRIMFTSREYFKQIIFSKFASEVLRDYIVSQMESFDEFEKTIDKAVDDNVLKLMYCGWTACM